jgi:hypothetical protein
MLSDLHWYVIPKFRGNGLLSHALTAHILPHVFLSRHIQEITIDAGFLGQRGFEASEKVALRVGFVKEKEEREKHSYILTNEKYPFDTESEGANEELAKSRMEAFQIQINYLSRSLLTLQTELELKRGVCEYTEELRLLSEEIGAHTRNLENFWWEQKKL